MSSRFGVTPAGLLIAARLSAYQGVADEVRIDSVTVTLVPVFGMTASGRVAFYLERDPAAAAVATVELASDQREVVTGRPQQTLRLSWRPQEPADREFNLLNPGTVSLGLFTIVADSLANSGVAVPIATNVFTARIVTRMTIRGRP